MKLMSIMNNEALKRKDNEIFKRFQLCYLRVMDILIRGKRSTKELEDYYIQTKELYKNNDNKFLVLIKEFSRIKL